MAFLFSCNAELTPEQKDTLVVWLKVFWLISTLALLFFSWVMPISMWAFVETPRLCRTNWRGWSLAALSYARQPASQDQ
jgi:hypothetical protein